MLYNLHYWESKIKKLRINQESLQSSMMQKTVSKNEDWRNEVLRFQSLDCIWELTGMIYKQIST